MLCAVGEMERLRGCCRHYRGVLRGAPVKMVAAKSIIADRVRLFFGRYWYYKAYFADGLGVFAGTASSIILISFSASAVPE